jgi:amino acid transporter
VIVPNSRLARLRIFLFGKPKDLSDHSIFHRLSLIPFLAWVGLGADGLSSSAYGPEEAYKALGPHTYMSVLLALLTGLTVFIISAAYRRIIEEFPHGGGGYVVASKLLGKRFGVVSGCALLVDYILTITVSIAAAGDALFSFMPLHLHVLKIPLEIGLILFLTVLNLRGVRESVIFLAPIFMVFLITHIIAIGGGILAHIPELPATTHAITTGFQGGLSSLGLGAMFLLFLHSYSLGGGTYTGLEAVSNGLPIMRDPKVFTAKRTMTYMAFSLALTAAGLLLCYLLWQVNYVEGKTLNAVLFEKMTAGLPGGWLFVIISLLSEGLLLVVGAQAGFIDGPRVLANMAVDSWFPRRFAALSERLTTGNGIVLMGATSLLVLLYSGGEVSKLVVMYSINVFLTFSLSIFGMLKSYLHEPKGKKHWKSGVLLFAVGFALCATILVITTVEKFSEGGWLTLTVTLGLVLVCFTIKAHYLDVAKKLRLLEISPKDLPKQNVSELPILDPKARTAAILVGGYGGLGIHTLRKILDTFPGVFHNLVFISVGVVDSGGFKGEAEIEALRHNTDEMLAKYVRLSHQLGVPSTSRSHVGTDVVQEGVVLCENLIQEFPNTTFFTGKVIFSEDRWYQRLLHNETGMALQKRLQLAGLTMVILPAKVI